MYVFYIRHVSGLSLQESSTETSDSQSVADTSSSIIPSCRAQTQNPSSKNTVAETASSKNPKSATLSSKQTTGSKISKLPSSTKVTKPSDKTKSTSKKGSGTLLFLITPG